MNAHIHQQILNLAKTMHTEATPEEWSDIVCQLVYTLDYNHAYDMPRDEFRAVVAKIVSNLRLRLPSHPNQLERVEAK